MNPLRDYDADLCSCRDQVLLEWDYSKGKPPAPLVKDKYGSERRKVRMTTTVAPFTHAWLTP
jgi:hypothetical protein